MIKLVQENADSMEQSIVRYLFWIFVITVGDPDIIDVVIGLIKSWS